MFQITGDLKHFFFPQITGDWKHFWSQKKKKFTLVYAVTAPKHIESTGGKVDGDGGAVTESSSTAF